MRFDKLKRLVDPTRPITYGIVQAGPEFEGGIPYIRPADMTDEIGVKDFEAIKHTSPEIAQQYRRSAVKTGDLVISIGPSFGKVMEVPSELDGANLTQGTARVAPGPNLHARFAFWCLRSQHCYSQWEAGIGGATFRALNLGPLAETRIPNPDLATQRQIADFLDRETARIDLLIEKKQRLVVLLGEQRAAAISSAVTVGLDDGVELVSTSSQYLPQVPVTWRVWRLKHLAEIRGGLTLGRNIADDVETTSTPYMRVANVQAGWLDLRDVAEIPVTKVEQKRYRLKDGDVLMNEGGDNDKLGRGAVWRSQINSCVHQNHVFAVRPHDTRYSDWISLATNASYARDFFYLHSNQSTNLASISKTNLARFPIALPPMDEMKATLDGLWGRVGKLDRISTKTAASIDRLKEYRSALITAAVTGQIEVQSYAKSGTPDRRLDAIQEELGA